MCSVIRGEIRGLLEGGDSRRYGAIMHLCLLTVGLSQDLSRPSSFDMCVPWVWVTAPIERLGDRLTAQMPSMTPRVSNLQPAALVRCIKSREEFGMRFVV